MKVIVCIDDGNGMLFNKRRQSRDRVLTETLLNMVGDENLYIAPFSALLFENANKEVIIDDNCLDKATANEYCFIENKKLAPYKDKITSLIVYKWNRRYPTDFRLDLDISKFEMVEVTEFAGYSHEKITREIYKIN